MRGADVMAQQPAVLATAVSHRYTEHTVLRDVDLLVPAGTVLGLLGPNGSGKSTLFRILSTLLPLQSGTVSVLGHDLAKDPVSVRRSIGVSFQSPALDVRLTVAENLHCQAGVLGLSKANARVAIGDLLRRFSMEQHTTSLVGTLSGGYRRRAEIVKALLHQPRILLLDEPTVGLDPAVRNDFWRELQRCRDELGTTVVVTTHLMDEAECCDQLVLLCDGTVAAAGTPGDLRGELGREQIRIRSDDIAALQQDIETTAEVPAQLRGNVLSLTPENSAVVTGRILERFGDRIDSLEVSRPTLEDVFLAVTGRSLSAKDAAA